MLKDELHEFVTICNRYNYIPPREEFQDIINFLLLFSGGDTTVCESILIDDLYEDSLSQINEKGEDTSYDPTKDTESAIGLATAGAATAVGAVAAASIGVGMFVQYLFKKGKVKAAIAKEQSTMMKKLDSFNVLYSKKKELAKLKGETFDGIGKLPGITDAPALPEKEKE